ncbi:MAG: response regulator transcription factor [Clostridiales bacterium]|nr:response regulator transcription factor [Clostridiales bacterium]MDD7432736.1 response regulator [Clostridiales bacterium]MDY3061194.1 response regulator [Eubacteriales bacterium]
MGAKVLVVDDESNIVDILTANLERNGYEVIAAYDGHQALQLALNENPDLILLDCMLPGMDGFDVCRKVRLHSSVPIIMLTAKSEEIDKVLGLELGADDYITKPFSVREVMARVKAQIRRINYAESDHSDDHQLVFGDLVIDQEAYEVTRGGEPLPLTLREFELLRFLARYAGQVFSRETLLEKVWGYEYYGDVRTVDVTVRRTREKVEPDQNNYRYLLTKRGVGYYFNKDCAEA